MKPFTLTTRLPVDLIGGESYRDCFKSLIKILEEQKFRITAIEKPADASDISRDEVTVIGEDLNFNPEGRTVRHVDSLNEEEINRWAEPAIFEGHPVRSVLTEFDGRHFLFHASPIPVEPVGVTSNTEVKSFRENLKIRFIKVSNEEL